MVWEIPGDDAPPVWNPSEHVPSYSSPNALTVTISPGVERTGNLWLKRFASDHSNFRKLVLAIVGESGLKGSVGDLADALPYSVYALESVQSEDLLGTIHFLRSKGWEVQGIIATGGVSNCLVGKAIKEHPVRFLATVGSNTPLKAPSTPLFHHAFPRTSSPKELSDWLLENEHSMTAWWTQYGTGRVLDVEGVQNFRHVGGYPTREGRVTRVGRLWRSGHPGGITESGVQTVLKHGIRTVFDLRSVGECAKYGTGEDLFAKHGIKRVYAPAYLDDDYSPMAMGMRFSLYSSGTEGFGYVYSQVAMKIVSAVRAMCDHILNNGTPFVLHCTAGKDRAGMTAAVFLAWAAGVDVDVVARDYGASQDIRKLSEEDRQRLAKEHDLTPDQVTNLNSTDPKGMHLAFTRLRRSLLGRHSTPSGEAPDPLETVEPDFLQFRKKYFQELVGLSSEQVLQVRDWLTEERSLVRDGHWKL
ncbi:hypothetical protein M427DRAFT_133745 [Gonapodya prolifera JEL478]|uniref:Tyrosine specific protein phosphatases domain-containing protein n=1 Tax=Gonapodya prolifera (strain JEL478) TaxID=1344416 RepID=A0A139AK80_GONPJ|nr:hypothetical protein M427DRAFT_133745 [Gonapodya prolifera JEL478]|eukprot:KXS16954.1 hypothetical protein M427DRAFT_133745 [Gonapodya prolifera JEL478]